MLFMNYKFRNHLVIIDRTLRRVLIMTFLTVRDMLMTGHSRNKNYQNVQVPDYYYVLYKLITEVCIA